MLLLRNLMVEQMLPLKVAKHEAVHAQFHDDYIFEP